MTRIKQIREARGITQGEFARLLGVTQGAVSQWECGLTMPRYDTMKRIAAALNTTIDELLRDDDRVVVEQEC